MGSVLAFSTQLRGFKPDQSRWIFKGEKILSDARVCSEKIAAPGEKSFCMLEYHTSKSVVTVQRAFRAKYAKDPPTDKTIRAWYI
jgi:hypothetical protein